MARRGENIYKRKDGRWEGRMRIEQPDGVIKLHSVYAHSYLEIKRKMKDFCAADYNPKTADRTVEYYTEQWLKAVKLRCKQSSYSKYSNVCKNHIIPVLGCIRVSCLNNEDIYRLLSANKALAPKTLSDVLCVLKMIYSYAESVGGKGRVHLDEISVRIPKSAVQVLSIDEQRKLVQYLLTDVDLVKLGIYLVICTGIRIGELCALRRECIDLQNGLLHIGATMQRVQTDDAEKKTEVIITEPKSACSVRVIPLTQSMIKIFAPHFLNMPDNAYLLTGVGGRFIEPNTMRYHFSKILNACGVQQIKFHALRHSFATRCVESGVDVKTLSEILGHENVNITLNRYVHSSVDLKRRSMEKLCCSDAYLPSILSSISAQGSSDKGLTDRLFQM